MDIGSSDGSSKGGDLKVMTQNLYLGASLDPAKLAAESGNIMQFISAAAEAYEAARATDFPLRAKSIAKTIAEENPDILALNEVAEWKTSRKTSGPSLPQYDFLKILRRELKKRGMDYEVACMVNNAKLEIPYLSPGHNCANIAVPGIDSDCVVTLCDRDVILIKKRNGLSWSKSKSGNFMTQQTFDVAGESLSFNRGWASINVKLNGAKMLVYTSHLEVETQELGHPGRSEVQHGQAQELLKIMSAHKNTATILAGDLNTDANGRNSDTYAMLTHSFFADSWHQAGESGQGHTCCQNGELSNPKSELDRSRIDLVLSHGNAIAYSASLVGTKRIRESPPPLWESDHAGYVASFRVR
jgi:endonuclease/exonuclease/phosphatase family metal-dependent hydrolase